MPRQPSAFQKREGIGTSNSRNFECHHGGNDGHHGSDQALIGLHPLRQAQGHRGKGGQCGVDGGQQTGPQRCGHHLDPFACLLHLLLGGVAHAVELGLQAAQGFSPVIGHGKGGHQPIDALHDLGGRANGFIAKQHFHGWGHFVGCQLLQALHDIHDGFFWCLLHLLGQLLRIDVEHVKHLDLAFGGCKAHRHGFHEVFAGGGGNLFGGPAREHGGRQGGRLRLRQSHGRQVGPLALQHAANVCGGGVHAVGNMVYGARKQGGLVHAQAHTAAPGFEHFAGLVARGVKGYAHLGRYLGKLRPFAFCKACLAGGNVGTNDFFAGHTGLYSQLLRSVGNGCQFLRCLVGHLIQLGQALLPVHGQFDRCPQRCGQGHAIQQGTTGIATGGHVGGLLSLDACRTFLHIALQLQGLDLLFDAQLRGLYAGTQLFVIFCQIFGADACCR